MNRFKFYLYFVSTLCIISCSSESKKGNPIEPEINNTKDEDTKNDKLVADVNFFEIDKSVTGKMDGESWTYGSAVFSEEEFLGIKSFDLTITKAVDDLCGFNYLKTQKISINMPGLTLGKYTMDDLYEMDDVSGIFIRDPKYKKDAGLMGWMVEEGVIEITNISEDKQTIEGYIEAYIDADFDLAGNFRAKRCDL